VRGLGLCSRAEADAYTGAFRRVLGCSYNRIHSIGEDAQFVATRVRSAYPALPIVGQSPLRWLRLDLPSRTSSWCPRLTPQSCPANQRAGAWYVKTNQNTPAGTSAEEYAYFKSTDGHIGQPAFNLRRANLVLLPLINHNKGSAPLFPPSDPSACFSEPLTSPSVLCSSIPPAEAR